MKMSPVNSSTVHSVGYDKDSKKMHVRFHTGKTYAYENVHPSEHAGLLASESAGQTLHLLKQRYRGALVENGED
jgi:hypothetical protein